MAIVRLRPPLKTQAGGQSEHEVAGETVSQLLLELERVQPALSGWILDERGAIRRHINVFVNGEQGEQSTSVKPTDRVDVLPAISGG
jgi:molybdopterin converting factor small subunit